MTRPRRTRALSVALLPVLALLAVVSAASPAHASAHYHQPVVGECHDYKIGAIAPFSESSATVDCASKHTAMVIASYTLPRRFPIKDNMVSKAAGVYISKHCDKAFDKAVGGRATTRALEAYSYDFFGPSKAEVRHGARWIRCDLILTGGRKIMNLPTSIQGRPPFPDSVALCLVVEPNHSYYGTVCSRPHNYRVEQAIQLSGGRYPARATFERIAAKRCPQSSGPRWFAHWPTAEAWTVYHDRLFVCSRKTTR